MAGFLRLVTTRFKVALPLRLVIREDMALARKNYRIYHNIPDESVVSRRLLLKGVLFAGAATISLFTFFSIVDHEKRALAVERSSTPRRLFFMGQPAVDSESRARGDGLVRKTYRQFQLWLAHFKGKLPFHIVHSWDSFSAKEKTIYSIITLNTCIFLAWKVPALNAFMSKYFLVSYNPSVRSFKPIGLLLGAFSHQHGMHLALNMIGLFTIGQSMHDLLGSREHFLFFYMSSAIWAAYFTSIYHVHFLRNLYYSSLGASGALCGLFGMTAHFPHIRLALIFIPFISIPAPMAVLGLVMYDLYGLYAKNNSFLAGPKVDHMAHLAGVAVGYAYWKWGRQHIWNNRDRYLRKIHYPISS